MAGNGNDFVLIQNSDPAIVGAGAGNDTYIISAALLDGTERITISDSQGANSIQLVSGLAIASSQVASTALKLTLSNGSELTILGANTFTYEPGGNAVNGINNPDVDYQTFVTGTLGTTVPASGTSTGGPVVIGSPGPATPTFSIAANSTAAAEGTSGTWTVTLASPTAGQAHAVTLGTAFVGTASAADIGAITTSGAGVTFDAATGALTFAAGTTSATIAVPFLTDTVTPETGEGVKLALTQIAGGVAAVSAQSSAVVMITDLPVGGGDDDVYTLTYDNDIATANIFNAPQVDTPAGDNYINSLQNEDQLTGRSDNPTLNATLSNFGDSSIITPIMNGIATLNIAFTGSGTDETVIALDLQDATGIQTANITRISQGTNRAEIGNMMAVTPTMSLANTHASANDNGYVEFSFAPGVLTGDNSGAIKVSNVFIGALNIGQNTSGMRGAGVGSQGYEHLALESTGAANTVGVLGLPMDTGTEGSVTITGDTDLTLAATGSVLSAAGSTNVEAQVFAGGIAQAEGRLASIDASGLEASLALAIGANLLSTAKVGTSGQVRNVTVTGTAQDDTFYLSDTVQAGDVLDGGDGADRVVVYANGDAGRIEAVEAVDVQINGNFANTISLDFDQIPGAVVENVRNITFGVVDGQNVSGDNGANQTVNLHNLTQEQAGALGIAHGTTGNNAIADTTLNAALKTDTAADSMTIIINEGINLDPRFNFTLTNQSLGAAAQQVIESLTFVDADTESNSVALGNVANYNKTITVGTTAGAGVAGTFINLDTAAAANWRLVGGMHDQRGGYSLDVEGGINDYSIANPTAAGANGSIRLAAVDTVFTTASLGLTANVRYNTLDNGVANEVRIVTEVFNAGAETSDVIARFGDVTRADGVSSMAVTGGAGSDTLILDAQGARNAGFTSGDTVKGGPGLDTLVIDGDTAAVQANLAVGVGVGGNVSARQSDWDNVSGIEVLRLAGNGNVTGGVLAQAVANVGTNAIVASSVNAGGYYIEIDNEFVRQTDAGNNLKIINNDGDLSTNLESDLVLNLRDLTPTSNVIFVGANGNGEPSATGAGKLSSNRLMLSDNSANGTNVLDGGDTVVDAFELPQATVDGVTYRASSGNNNVLEIFNSAILSVADLSKTRNFGRIEATNDAATPQTLVLMLNDTVMDQLVDAGTAARVASATGVPSNIERLVVVANNNAAVPGAVENLNINASTVTNKFGLDVLVARGSTNNIVGTAGNDKVVIQGNYTVAEQAADGHTAVTLFQGASAINGGNLLANGVAYKGVDGMAGTADDVLLADSSVYALGSGDTLEVFGGLNLAGATIAAGTAIVAHSSVQLTSEQFSMVSAINFLGSGPHQLIISNNTSVTPENAPNLTKVTCNAVGAVVNVAYGNEVPPGTRMFFSVDGNEDPAAPWLVGIQDAAAVAIGIV